MIFHTETVDRSNPWRTLSSRLIYENPWISVREDQVLRPDGQPGIYGVVGTPVAVGALAATDKNEIYLVGQWRYAMEQWSWEIPEGGAQKQEDPCEAAKRELREEAGVIADNWRPLGGELHLSNSFTDERAHIFLATGLTSCAKDPDPTERLEVRCTPLDEVVAMLDRGVITDAISVVAIHRYLRLLATQDI